MCPDERNIIRGLTLIRGRNLAGRSELISGHTLNFIPILHLSRIELISRGFQRFCNFHSLIGEPSYDFNAIIISNAGRHRVKSRCEARSCARVRSLDPQRRNTHENTVGFRTAGISFHKGERENNRNSTFPSPSLLRSITFTGSALIYL